MAVFPQRSATSNMKSTNKQIGQFARNKTASLRLSNLIRRTDQKTFAEVKVRVPVKRLVSLICCCAAMIVTAAFGGEGVPIETAQLDNQVVYSVSVSTNQVTP